MGSQVSSSTKFSENELLRRFSGLEPITDNDPLWNQMLSFNLKFSESTRMEEKKIEEGLTDVLEALMYNTPTTGNFAAFARVFLRRAVELKTSAQCDDRIFLWQMENALVVLRFCCKFLVMRLSDSEFTRIFRKNIPVQDGAAETGADESPAEELMNSLIQILVDLGVNDLTASVHLEAGKCLLVMLSSPLFAEKPRQSSAPFGFLTSGSCSIHVPLLTKTLLRNFISPSVRARHCSEGGGSLVVGLATSMWQVLGLGGDGSAESDEPDLGTLSLLLLLTLASQQQLPLALPKPNPFRQALSSFQNAQEVSSLGQHPTDSIVAFKLDYGALYERLSASVNSEAPMLLLYILLHRNSGFRNYVLSRINLENLVLKVLRVLHSGRQDGGNSHHVYLALIVILILSEDDFFCKLIHETKIKRVDWYERAVSEISLGGLIILVLTRTIQHNIVRVRDRYLHTNCLAALANMSAFFKELAPSVAQKLVGLLELLTRRHSKLVEHIRLSAEYDLASQSQATNSANQDLTALEEGIRTLLEILNSCLTHGLRHNPHLIYTMLYNRDLFLGYQQHPMFQDLIWNITAVLDHFTSRVATLEKGVGVGEVLEIIQKGALQWPTDRLKKFPDLKFKYVEDENTDEFFVPYIWTLVYKSASVYWDATRVRLFNAQPLLVVDV